MNTQQDSDSKDVVVIGAGIVGICTALFLQERNFNVTVIDKTGPAEACSHGNAGVLCTWSTVPESLPGEWKKIPRWLIDPMGPVFIRPGYIPKMIPWLIRFLKAGRVDRVNEIADAMAAVNNPCVDLYRELLAGTGHEDLIRDSSYIYAYRNPENVDPQSLAWRLRRDRGAPLEFLDGDQLRQIEPALSKMYKAGVRVKGQGHTVNPGRLGKVLAEKVERQGGVIKLDEVRNVEPRNDGGFTLTLASGTVQTPRLVIAGGAWSNQLTANLGCDMPLEAERGYHAVMSDPGVELTNVVSDGERYCALTSMEMGLRVAGTVEFAGVDTEPNYERAKTLVQLAKDALPDLNVGEPEYWMGPRPAFPDTIPVISELPEHSNAFVTCGHSHLGLTGAPMSGRLIAAMADGDRTDTDMEPFRADRF